MGVIQFLERAPVFSGVDPACIERMSSHTTTRTYERGELLWRAGDPAQALTLIRSGLVKVVRTAARGRSAICGLFGPHETVGDVALLKGLAHAADAIAASDSVTVVTLPRKVVLDEAQRLPQLSLSIACSMHEKLAALHDKIDVLSAGSVEARLATLLLKLYDKFGDDFEDGTSRIPVALSRRDLADLVSTSFETAIRVMTRWEREGTVSTESDGFVLRNLATLESMSGSTSSVHAAAE
jgi:CRP/FNR family transcriptional regulator